MRRSVTVLALIIIAVSILYHSMPLFGINITLSEVLSKLGIYNQTPPEHLGIQLAYSIKPYVTNLSGPRFMVVTELGDLIVSEPDKGRLILIPYNKPENKIILLSKLNKAHSVDIFQNYLYVAEEDAIGRVQFDANKKRIIGKYEHFITNLPADGGHWTRTIKFGPDGYGYVSIGSSCNACIEKNPLRAIIGRFKPGDSQLEIYSTGLRNSVGLDWSPLDGQLYATENGRDMLGDHLPPDELNLIKAQQFYGWPYAYGNRVPDPEFGQGNESRIESSIPPVHEFPAHVAPLGLMFFKDPTNPLYGKALVAFHGSWNSSVKVGYKVVILSFEHGKIEQEDFLVGFISNGTVKGRPVQTVEGKHGELYLSDDYNGLVYKLSKTNEEE